MGESLSWWGVASAVGALTSLGLLFGALLGLASARFKGDENPLVEQIDALLPQTQCGQCGYPGCRPYAEAINQAFTELRDVNLRYQALSHEQSIALLNALTTQERQMALEFLNRRGPRDGRDGFRGRERGFGGPRGPGGPRSGGPSGFGAGSPPLDPPLDPAAQDTNR